MGIVLSTQNKRYEDTNVHLFTDDAGGGKMVRGYEFQVVYSFLCVFYGSGSVSSVVIVDQDEKQLWELSGEVERMEGDVQKLDVSVVHLLSDDDR